MIMDGNRHWTFSSWNLRRARDTRPDLTAKSLSDYREISYLLTIPTLSRYPPRSSGATATSHLSANGDAPGYYLKHDVYGNYNPAGAIYLDADCEELGLSSRNAVILGHHFWNDKKVAPMGTVADYKDEDFAREHARVLIQTPTSKMTYEARFAQIVNGRERNKRIDFEGEADFRAWYGESRANAAMVLDVETEPGQVISLVTCSYNIWVDNERTVLVTSMQETAKNQAENTQIAPDAS